MRPSRLLPALAGLALVLTTLAAVPPPAGAAGTGTLAIVMVDENGDPMPGQIAAVDSNGPAGQTGSQTATLEQEVPAGVYGAFGISPWGGLLCEGWSSPCDYVSLMGGAVPPDGSVVVAEGQRTEVVLRADVPGTLSGPAVVGKPLTVDWSDGMEALIDFFELQGGGFYVPVMQWQRNGEPIAGEVASTYVPVGTDLGQEISAVLTYQSVMLQQWEQITGTPVTPRTTNGVTVTRTKTKSFANLANPTIPAGRQGRVRVDVTAPDVTVLGKVRITVGDWKRTETLRNGSARVVLPSLPPGRHKVKARYLGTDEFAPSEAKPQVLTVERD